MTIKDKMKQYNFWISLVSAVLLVARIIAGKFNYEIDSSLIMDVTTGLCGIFVILGIISAPQKTVTKIVESIKTVYPETDASFLVNENASQTNENVVGCASEATEENSIISEPAIIKAEPNDPNAPSVTMAEENADTSATMVEDNTEEIPETQETKEFNEPVSQTEGKTNVETIVETTEPESVEQEIGIKVQAQNNEDGEQENAQKVVASETNNESEPNFVAFGGVVYDFSKLTKEEIINLIKTNK